MFRRIRIFTYSALQSLFSSSGLEDRFVQKLWNRQLRFAFDTWAPSYRKVAEAKLKSRGYSYEELAARVWRFLECPKSGIIIEIGCGPGLVGMRLPLQSGVHLVGVDISRRMLEHADTGIYAGLVHASAESLPFPTGMIDGVFSTFCLHSTRQRLRVIEEIGRILRPGAHAVIVDLCVASRGLSFYHFLSTNFHSLRFEMGAPSNYFTMSELVDDLQRTGFEVLHVEQLGQRKKYTHQLVAFRLPISRNCSTSISSPAKILADNGHGL